MANQWFRLWHDMPNDPKWRTISRASKQPITSVISVYLHMLVIGSNATERGRTQEFCDEDVASALDLETEQVTAIREAMQGRVLDGDRLTGWDKRQPLKEDGAAERARLWREKQKKEDAERNRTRANASERQDKDKDKDKDLNTPITPKGVSEGDSETPAGKETRLKKSPIALKTFLDDCKRNGVEAVPIDDPIFKHCDDVGIPDEFIALCWNEFIDRHREKSKKYSDWRQAFRNCVRDNWFHLWAVNGEGQVFLTTQGKFAQRKYGTQTAAA